MEQNQARQNEDMLKNIENLLGNILAKQSRPQSSTSNFSANSYDRINIKSPIPLKSSISVQQEQSMENDVRQFVSQHIQDIVPDLVVHVEQDLTDVPIKRYELPEHYSTSELEDSESSDEYDQNYEAIDNNEILNINRFLEKELDHATSDTGTNSEILQINEFLQTELNTDTINDTIDDVAIPAQEHIQVKQKVESANIISNKDLALVSAMETESVVQSVPTKKQLATGHRKKKSQDKMLKPQKKDAITTSDVQSQNVIMNSSSKEVTKVIPNVVPTTLPEQNTISTSKNAITDSIKNIVTAVSPTPPVASAEINQNRDTTAVRADNSSYVTLRNEEAEVAIVQLSTSTTVLADKVDSLTIHALASHDNGEKSLTTQIEKLSKSSENLTVPENHSDVIHLEDGNSSSDSFQKQVSGVKPSVSTVVLPEEVSNSTVIFSPTDSIIDNATSKTVTSPHIDIPSPSALVVTGVPQTPSTNILLEGKNESINLTDVDPIKIDLTKSIKTKDSQLEKVKQTTKKTKPSNTKIDPKLSKSNEVSNKADIISNTITINVQDNNQLTATTSLEIMSETQKSAQPVQITKKTISNSENTLNTQVSTSKSIMPSPIMAGPTGNKQKMRKRRQKQRDRKQSIEMASSPVTLLTPEVLKPSTLEDQNLMFDTVNENQQSKQINEVRSLTPPQNNSISVPENGAQETGLKNDLVETIENETESSEESDAELNTEVHIVPEINIISELEENSSIDLSQVVAQSEINQISVNPQEHRPSSALQMNLANDYIEMETIETDSVETTINNDLLPAERITPMEDESIESSDLEPDSYSEDSETEHESDPNETNDSVLSEDVAEPKVTDKSQQNLSDLVSDTQKLIKQMRDEINSDIASFVSDDDEYSDYDNESYTEEWSEEGDEYEGEEEEEYEDDDEAIIEEGNEEGEWTDTEGEYDSEYYEQEEEIEPKTSISQDVRSSESIESEQFVEAQEQVDLYIEANTETELHDYTSVLPPAEFLDHTQIAEPLSGQKIAITEQSDGSDLRDSDKPEAMPLEAPIVELIKSDSMSSVAVDIADTHIPPMYSNHPVLLENIANIQKSLHVTTTVLVERSLQGNREVLSPDFSASVTPDRGSSISLNSIDQDNSIVHSLETQNRNSTVEIGVEDNLDKSVDKSAPKVNEIAIGDENASENTLSPSRVENEPIETHIVFLNASSVEDNLPSPSTKLPVESKHVEPQIATEEIAVEIINEVVPSPELPKLISPVSSISTNLSESIPPAKVITTSSTLSPVLTTASVSEPTAIKTPTTKIVKKIPVRKTSLPGPFGSLRTSNVKAMQQELLNKTVIKPQMLSTKPSKIVPPKVYSKPTTISSTLSERITKFIKPFTGTNSNAGSSSSAGISGAAKNNIAGSSKQDIKPVKREIPKKKYHETCFSDDYQSSEDEVIVAKPRQMPMRQQSMPNIMQTHFDEDESTEVSLFMALCVYFVSFDFFSKYLLNTHYLFDNTFSIYAFTHNSMTNKY